jgi:hypothetical protein
MSQISPEHIRETNLALIHRNEKEFTYHWSVSPDKHILPDFASKERSKESIKCNH